MADGEAFMTSAEYRERFGSQLSANKRKAQVRPRIFMRSLLRLVFLVWDVYACAA